VTAHPIELIAEMDDGIDLDEKDQVTRHIASCDTCRTVARTMQRIDGLIAMPEPVLPLPARVAPGGSVHVAGWTAVVAVVLTLAVATAALVGSYKQMQVATAAADTCGILAAAAHSAGVGAATAKTSPIELPSSLSGSWTACGYGDTAARGGPWLLFRSVPTAGWQVRGLLARLTSADLGNQFVFGKFVPCTGDALTETWISEPGTCDWGTGRAMAVVAEPYFFVVTLPSPGASERLADAIVAELRRRPWPPLSEASKIDACNVIKRAAPSAGLLANAPSGSSMTHRHWIDMSVATVSPEMMTNVCAFGTDDGLSDPHLFLRDQPTTREQANGLFPVHLMFDSTTVLNVYGWAEIEPGMWLVHGEDPISHCRDCGPQRVPWYVAVSDEPYFFVVTQATDEAAIQLARAVRAELKRP
jgi:hypothetical protein